MNDGKKVSFTREFLDKTKYHRTRARRGEVQELFDQLTEVDLAKCQTRADLARKLGYTTTTMKQGNTTIGNLVRKGKLIEYPLGYNIGRAKAFAFAFPNDDPRVEVKTTHATKTVEKKEVSTTPTTTSETRVCITFSDMSVSLENPTPELIESVFGKLDLLRTSK